MGGQGRRGGGGGGGGGAGGSDASLRQKLLAVLLPGGIGNGSGGGNGRGGGGGGRGPRGGGGGGPTRRGGGGSDFLGGGEFSHGNGVGGGSGNRAVLANNARGSGGGGGPLTRGGNAAAANGGPHWPCVVCGFRANFATRSACFQCRAPRGGVGSPAGGFRPRDASGGGARTGPPGIGNGGTAAARGGPGGIPPRETNALGRPPFTVPQAASLRPQAAWRTAASLGARDGPIGADGKRPLLSSSLAGVAARRPAPAAAAGPLHGGGATAISATNGGPSSSAGSGTQATTQGGGATGSAVATAMPAAVHDQQGVTGSSGGGRLQPGADGFITVQARPRGGWRRAANGTNVEGQATAATPSPALPVGSSLELGATPAAVQADCTQTTTDQSMGEAVDVQEDMEQVHGPTVAELREAHARDREVADYLAQQGYGLDHPVRAAAEAQAAEAKRAWDEARPGAAVSQRIVWAEKALVRAKRNQSRMEQAIDDLDRDYEAKRDAWLQQLADLRCKTREREEKLAEVSRQAAVEFRSAGDGNGNGPLRDAAEALEATVTPTIESLLAHIPADSPARQKVEQVVEMLKGVQGTVAKASRSSWADIYDIADDDAWEEDDEPWRNQHGGWASAPWEGTCHDHYDEGTQRDHGWYYDGWGQWRRDHTHPHTDHDGDMDTGEVQVPSWMEQSARDPHQIARADKRIKVDDDDHNGMQGRHVGGADGDAEHHASAARLQAAIQDAAATASLAAPAPQTPTAAEHAALERRRHEVWDMAQDQGAEITQQAIAGMASEELEEWATANLL